MEMTKGTLYGVGVGPGDPELMTRKACRVLSACPVIACPRTRQGHMLALDIASRAGDLAGKEILPLDFAMERTSERRQGLYEAAAEALAAKLAAGKDVAFLTLGDVSVFSTFGYLAGAVADRGFRTVMIPGVTSFSAVAARLGVSLTEMDGPLSILPAGTEDLEAELDRPGTKVILKTGKSIPRVRESLERKGLLDRTSLVADCGLPGERVFRDLTDLPEDLGYFATFVVKE